MQFGDCTQNIEYTILVSVERKLKFNFSAIQEEKESKDRERANMEDGYNVETELYQIIHGSSTERAVYIALCTPQMYRESRGERLWPFITARRRRD